MPRFGTLDDDDESCTVVCGACNGSGVVFDDNDPQAQKALEKTGIEAPCPICNGLGYLY